MFLQNKTLCKPLPVDPRHHVTDVLAGSLIGALVGLLASWPLHPPDRPERKQVGTAQASRDRCAGRQSYWCASGTAGQLAAPPTGPAREKAGRKHQPSLPTGPKQVEGKNIQAMDERTLKTPIPKCRLYWSFCLGW